MSITQGIGEHLAQIGTVLRGPTVPRGEIVDHRTKCLHCQDAIILGGQAYLYAWNNLAQSLAVSTNLDVQVRHRIVAVWGLENDVNPIQWNHKNAWECEVRVYSHELQMYVLLMGIQSVYRVHRHT